MDIGTITIWSVTVQFLVGPIALLVVGWFLDRRNKNRVARVQGELNNNHKDNIRDDLDSKFKLMFAKLDRSTTLQKKQGRVIIAMRNDIAQLFENDAEQLHDVEELRAEINRVVPKED